MVTPDEGVVEGTDDGVEMDSSGDFPAANDSTNGTRKLMCHFGLRLQWMKIQGFGYWYLFTAVESHYYDYLDLGWFFLQHTQ